MDERQEAENREGKAKGIRCPECGCGHFDVTHSWPEAGRVKRRRVCRNCGRPTTTFEKIAKGAT